MIEKQNNAYNKVGAGACHEVTLADTTLGVVAMVLIVVKVSV